MSSVSDNSKRIAKNTVFLYLRMLFVMAISLFTSRVIINALGVEDYGIQNVVGGFVSMFSLISSTMYSTISRFMTYELGRGDLDRLKKVFSTSMNIQILMAILIVVLAESIGIWFLNYKMNIPESRLSAANWVFQFSLLSFVISITSAPYYAAIISHEKMSDYAIFSILEAVMKLIIVYLLFVSPIDKLVLYSVLLFLVSFTMRLIYGVYCGRKFVECKYHIVIDKGILKEMGSFAGWNYLGAIAFILRGQGINLLLNLFFGVTVNAARGIASQIESAVSQFVGSFTMALNPQITKNYAQNKIDYMQKLVCKGGKYSFFLMLLITIPLVIEAPIVLKIWLNNVPEYTILFMRLTLLIMLADAFTNPITTAILATGKVKKFSILLSSIMIAIFPVSYIVFKLGGAAYSAYLVWGFAVVVRMIFQLPILKKLTGFSISVFIRDAIVPCGVVLAVSLIVPIIIVRLIDSGIVRFSLLLFSSLLWTLLVAFFGGLTKDERMFVRFKMLGIIHKGKNDTEE